MRSIGFTGASKLLHLLAPKFFVMWDVGIRKYYGLGQDAGSYFEFLRRMRREIREAVKGYAKDKGVEDFREARNALEEELGKPLTKVIDEYNYLTITKNINSKTVL